MILNLEMLLIKMNLEDQKLVMGLVMPSAVLYMRLQKKNVLVSKAILFGVYLS